MAIQSTKRSSARRPEASAGDRRERISGRTLGLIISTAILFAILALQSQSFLSGYTMFVISRQMAFYVLIALAQAFCLIVGQMSLFGVPYVFLLTVILLGGVGYMFRNTVFGRRMLATGGNAAAARLSGINTDRLVVWAHVLSGAAAAWAAVLWASKLGSAAPETGDDWLIVSFAVAIIGGTGLSGGMISALGIFMGAAIFMLTKHGLVEVKANSYYANSFLGLLILLAIIVDRVREIYSVKQKGK